MGAARTGREPHTVDTYFDSRLGAFYKSPTRMSREHARIIATYSPATGWVDYPGGIRITRNRARTLRTEGITAVTVKCEGLTADFQITELLKTQP